MAPVDLLNASSPSSLIRTLPYGTTLSASPYYTTPYYSSFLHEHENMVNRVRVVEEEALRWRNFAESVQQEKVSLATAEGMAQANLHMAKVEIEKQGQLLKSTDAQLLTVRDDLRRLFEASQRKEEQLAGEVASLKNQLLSSRADNQKLKQDLEVSEYTSKQRAELVTLRNTQVQELRGELDLTKQEHVRLREELTVSRAEGERTKLLLDAESANLKRHGELLLLRDSEVKEKTSDVMKLRTDLEMQLAHNRKIEFDLNAYHKSLQATGDALRARTTDCEKLTVELTDTKSREISQNLKVQRMEQDTKFWTEAYYGYHKDLGYLRSYVDPLKAYPIELHKTYPSALPPPLPLPASTSIYRSKLLDAQAKAAAFEETLARIRAGQFDQKDTVKDT